MFGHIHEPLIAFLVLIAYCFIRIGYFFNISSERFSIIDPKIKVMLNPYMTMKHAPFMDACKISQSRSIIPSYQSESDPI